MATATEISDVEYRKLIAKPIVKSTDMTKDMTIEVIDIISMAVDKFAATKNYEATTQLIKSSMDKKFGATWHCVIGEGLGFDITYQGNHLMYLFYGSIGVVLFKC